MTHEPNNPLDFPHVAQASWDVELYRENVLDHYHEPHNVGAMENATFHHHELNPSCGDTIELFVKLDNGDVRDVTFVGQGCAISQAAVSMLTDRIKGLTESELRALTPDDIFTLLGFPVGMTRLRCALLGLKTLQVGLANYQKTTQL